jgi:formamidopyrimidine-DNA glycosylase
VPELPEVETITRDLIPALTGQRVESVVQSAYKLRTMMPKNLNKKLSGTEIERVSRRAKYILIALSCGECLVIHLGMTGTLRVTSTEDRLRENPAHLHLKIRFRSGDELLFCDPRRFGLVTLVPQIGLDAHPLFARLGPEPLEKEFSARYLEKFLKGRRIAIKPLLLDQSAVVGIGNIYASEALFLARIDPRRPAGELAGHEISALVLAIKKVLRKAIEAGGSSLRDYRKLDGQRGGFQKEFSVYGREGLPCSGCVCKAQETGGVVKIIQGGRSSFYCPHKQG